MHPTELLIFGNPKSGTPLMIASPTLAIDLPLKALVWGDGGGKVWISYKSPEYLRRRHNIPDTLLQNVLLQNVSSVRSIGIPDVARFCEPRCAGVDCAYEQKEN
jgi:uncharacterized protein (DUF302 family)